jgi:hypothetical protein
MNLFYEILALVFVVPIFLIIIVGIFAIWFQCVMWIKNAIFNIYKVIRHGWQD